MRNIISRFINDRLYINALFLMSTNFMLVGMGFLFWVICARGYSSNDVGFASTIISAMLLLVSISTLGLNWGLIRFLPEASEKEGEEIINSTITVIFFTSLILSLVFLMGLWLWSPKLIFLWNNPLYIGLFVGIVIVLSLSPLIDSIFVAKRLSKFILYRNFIWSGLKLFLPIILIGLSSIGIVGSYGISAFISIIIGVFLFIPRLYPRLKLRLILEIRQIKNIFNFSMGNYIAGFLGSLPTILFPLIITELYNPKITAYFFITWTIGVIFQQISHAISLSFLVESSHKPEDLKPNLKKAITFTSIMIIPLIVIFFYFGGVILSIFGNDYSTNGFNLLRVLALVSPFIVCVHIYLGVQRVKKNVLIIVILMGIIGIGSVALGLVFLYLWGLVGIGFAWGLSHLFAIIYIAIYEVIYDPRKKYNI